ncbi:YkvA family protein [Devosia sp. A449]
MFSTLLPRIVLFRKEALLLWKALLARETPLYLKAATLFAAFYLINPFDIIPDVLPFIGWVDDLILIPLMVSWIVSRLPVPVRADPRERNGQTIDGQARRV